MQGGGGKPWYKQERFYAKEQSLEENNLMSTKNEVNIERKLVREGVKHMLFRTLPQKEGGGSTPRPQMLAKKVYCLQYVYTNTFSSIFFLS